MDTSHQARQDLGITTDDAILRPSLEVRHPVQPHSHHDLFILELVFHRNQTPGHDRQPGRTRNHLIDQYRAERSFSDCGGRARRSHHTRSIRGKPYGRRSCRLCGHRRVRWPHSGSAEQANAEVVRTSSSTGPDSRFIPMMEFQITAAGSTDRPDHHEARVFFGTDTRSSRRILRLAPLLLVRERRLCTTSSCPSSVNRRQRLPYPVFGRVREKSFPYCRPNTIRWSASYASGSRMRRLKRPSRSSSVTFRSSRAPYPAGIFGALCSHLALRHRYEISPRLRRQLAQGNNAPIPLVAFTHDEVGELTQVFNVMTQILVRSKSSDH